MAKVTCSIEGCEEEVIARGWCQRHYSRWYAHGDPEASPVERKGRPRSIPKECSVDGCDKPHDSRGYCSMHYSRWLRHGDPLVVKKQRNRNNVLPCSEDGCEGISRTAGLCDRHYRLLLQGRRGACSVEGCETPWQSGGLCMKHYVRMRSHGTTDDPAAPPLRGSCSIEGCEEPIKARKLCGMHLRRWYVYGTTDLPMKPRERTCRFCKQTKPANQFTVAANACAECLPLHRAELKRITLPRTKEVRAREDELREIQGDRCAICKVAEVDAPKGRLHTDHDHSERGVAGIRGLLCGNCNSGLGHFKDSPELLAAAIRYLEEASPGGQLTLFPAA